MDALQAFADAKGLATAREGEGTSSAFLAPKGDWFDEDLDFAGPEGDALTEALLAEIDAVDMRDRKRRAVDLANHRIFVRKLAVNGFRAVRFHNPPLVAVRRKGDGYKGRSRWLNGKAMKRETTLLQKAGLIEVNSGEQGVASTTYRVTGAFLIAAMNARLTERNLIHRLPPERLVRVYRTNSDDGETVDFNPTNETRQWTAKLDAYNGFIAEQDIGIKLSEAETARLTARMNEERKKGVPRLVRPDLIRKGVFSAIQQWIVRGGREALRRVVDQLSAGIAITDHDQRPANGGAGFLRLRDPDAVS
jgi:hypothetical protein